MEYVIALKKRKFTSIKLILNWRANTQSSNMWLWLYVSFRFILFFSSLFVVQLPMSGRHLSWVLSPRNHFNARRMKSRKFRAARQQSVSTRIFKELLLQCKCTICVVVKAYKIPINLHFFTLFHSSLSIYSNFISLMMEKQKSRNRSRVEWSTQGRGSIKYSVDRCGLWSGGTKIMRLYICFIQCSLIPLSAPATQPVDYRIKAIPLHLLQLETRQKLGI